MSEPSRAVSDPGRRVQGLRVALVHDWLITLGGSDRVLLALHEVFPDAPVYTFLADPARLPAPFACLPVRTSWLQRLPGATSRHRWLVPLMPLAARTFDLRGVQVVLSSSHACAKGVLVPPRAVHICYCHTPMRYAWELRGTYLQAMPPVIRPLAAAALGWLRRWDHATSARVHHFIANSRHVAARIRAHYGREATVIYPPVDTAFFTPGERRTGEEYFLTVGRLVPYKRIDLAVEAFTRARRPLVVVGDGPEAPRLRALAGPTVRFVGEVSDDVLRDYYRGCRAVVFPGVEDFGLVPVEAQACGRPVIAYAEGGALESVVEGETGLFFRLPTPEALFGAVQAFERRRFDPGVIRRHAERFSVPRFQAEIASFVGQVWWSTSRA
ncbi:MAG: glycosyltransferase [Armatimonadota bacterium]|nr:glycosyltransferase [Armatimonadota bacterium]MDR7450403.1 glycosyltransferase [Armatimonadota bacterium]MDR7467014.1 glycosyltransferase [Armatimonadota bacterium]MDR7493444.1 glycosyltransferase [Armatimonadota bacterium]MDR7498709.1 glycosyltransferase [Armatimonadota bacterium]